MAPSRQHLVLHILSLIIAFVKNWLLDIFWSKLYKYPFQGQLCLNGEHSYHSRVSSLSGKFFHTQGWY
ncbi:hypothetical protein GLYMA_09G230000v4 [Glycine max]|uniref:Uncharacterized protein n=2 Tax=Glycine subgen. Soja TaxID=1462606 RepID=K7LFJ6_SOYBN|nr:hypothetical protein JHK85_026555 [Glycine max]KHN11675.1 hypothetical protein glysoja_006128 [Glycine soja]KAG5013811.1 hypothetical protein JHK86_026072 [Glycine max]KAH1044382.1 hypothetical protein GYH30_025915 [Glycine max]KRH39950.1 hypothetical protein GLYMA_09G230000v4 [Glycine max]